MRSKTGTKLRMFAAGAAACAVMLSACISAPSAKASQMQHVIDNGGVPVQSQALAAELSLRTGMRTEILAGASEAKPESNAATGQQAAFYDDAGDLVSMQEIVVMGDVTGTGAPGLSQLVELSRAFRAEQNLEGACLTAGDFNRSGGIDLGDLAAAAAQLRESSAPAPQVTSRTVPMYLQSPSDVQNVPLYFVDGTEDIPYVSTDTVLSALRMMLAMVEADDISQKDAEDGRVVFERSSGSRCELNFVDGTITFTNFNTFLAAPYTGTTLDLLNTSGLTEEEEAWFFRRPAGGYTRSGLPVVVDLASKDIATPYVGKTGYIPLQTFSDFFLTPFGFQALYNGAMVGIITEGEPGELEEVYYSASPRERSDALARFMYAELCLVLDSYYGLKEQHDITDFDALFEQTGLKSRLLSRDPVQADTALYELAAGYLGDLHTSFLNNSFYAGKDADTVSSNISASVRAYHTARRSFQQARLTAYPDGVPGYEEIGSTAFVTIDRLTWSGTDYYVNPPGPDADDTIGLIAYAHEQITREDSPIETVVLDLSANGGGLVDAAVYVLAWFTGEARLDVNDTMTQAQASIPYEADVNLDGKFDADDTITDLNRYCIISPLSFSCGNIIPAALKAAPDVTLVGQKSAGGACMLWNITTADGSMMQISGPVRMSTWTNGAFYDIDRGVEPDFPIALPDDFYDRNALAERLNSLFR